ncbi:MAG: arginine deiminase-related protein [Nanoarchaeota archaeon]
MTKFLMCKPTHLHEISYQINPFMKKGEKIDNSLALKQHSNLVKILEENGAEVEFLEPQEGLIDMIFTANAGIVYGDKFILPNFKHAERRSEVQHYMEWAREQGYEVVSLPTDVFFEGRGDVTWIDDKNMFLGFGEMRTNYEAIDALQKVMPNVNIIPLRLVDERFYHLDTCLQVLNNREFLYYKKAFDELSVKKIEKEASQKFTLAEDEALTYICNSIKFGNKLVADKCRWVSESYLNYEGYQVQQVDLSELRKGGGSARCMVLEIG